MSAPPAPEPPMAKPVGRPTAASRARQGPGPSQGQGQGPRQGPGPAQGARQGPGPAQARPTPAPKASSKTVPVPPVTAPRRKKACSTPTKEDVTMSDLTLDVTSIGARPSLDTTVGPPLPLPRGRAGAGARGQAGARAKQPLGTARVPQSTSKNMSRPKELPEDEITEEMVDEAYNRYLMTAYVKMKSKENRKAVEKKLEKQLFQAFTATEELRQKVMRKRREKAAALALGRLRSSLDLAGRHLGPAAEALAGIESRLGRLAAGLGDLQHSIAVKGVTVGEEAAQEELEAVCGQLEELVAGMGGTEAALEARAEGTQEIAEVLGSLDQSYRGSVQLVKECRALAERAEGLVIQDMSLALSLEQLRIATEQKAAAAAAAVLVDI